MKRTNSRGFTLVELMLAMVFVSGLLLAIALLTMQVINIYTKGITLSAVDQAGQVIAKELRDSTNGAIPSNITAVQMGAGDATAGRYCTGTISYAWNSGVTINGSGVANIYAAVSGNAARDIRFVKVKDPGALLCSNNNLSPNITKANATELLSSVDRNLAIRQLKITHADLSGSQAIYSFSLVVATNDAGQFISGQQNCQAPNTATNPDEFCATNSFDFTARAGNNLISGSSK